MKPKFSIASLTGCSGCIGTILALDILSEFLERIDLVYSPFLMDQVEIQEVDVALIEGCISEESQIAIIKEVRKKSKKIIALGTCAAFGGILSLSTEKEALPISNYIEIDEIIPGCPPPPKLLGNNIMRLLENKDIILPEKNLCATCPLRGDLEIDFGKQVNNLQPEYTAENITRCFLSDNILCMGPVVREGCECRCINCGIPCEGCMGPITQDYTSNVINFLSMLKLSKNLRKYDGIFFRFAKPKIKREK